MSSFKKEHDHGKDRSTNSRSVAVACAVAQRLPAESGTSRSAGHTHPGTNRSAGHTHPGTNRSAATPIPAPTAAPTTPIQVPAEAQTAPQGVRPDAPTYAVHGPFAVGYKPLVIGAGTKHPLEGSLWYPALNPTGRKEEVTYAIKLKDSAWSTDLPKVVYGHALLNADIDVSKGPYPLVVWSHGFVASAAWNSNLLEHYASYGFIILAPEHTEQLNDSDFAAVPMAWSDLWKSSIDRPLDIKQTLDYAEKLTAPGGALAGLIDMQHVAVVGHSSGGYTALAMAGAQYDLEAFNARCAQLPADDPNTFLCTFSGAKGSGYGRPRRPRSHAPRAVAIYG